MDPADSDQLSRVWSYSGAGREGLLLPHTGLSPAMVVLSRTLLLAKALVTPAIEGRVVLQPRGDESPRFGLIRFRSPLLTESLLLSLPGGTEMFQFPPFASGTYGFSAG